MFGTVELLELILLHLEFADLSRCFRVCQRFKATIDASKSLRTCLWLHTDKQDLLDQRKALANLNQDVMSEHDPSFSAKNRMVCARLSHAAVPTSIGTNCEGDVLTIIDSIRTFPPPQSPPYDLRLAAPLKSSDGLLHEWWGFRTRHRPTH